MTNPMTITLTDYRRASALLAHFSRDDTAGVDAIIDEAENDNRTRPLIWCLPAVLYGIQDGWEDDKVADILTAFSTGFAQREATE